MKFSKVQKEIIKCIEDNKVNDITSFLQEFEYTKEFKYNEDKIVDTFNKMEKGKTYRVLKEGLNPFSMTISPSGKLQNTQNYFNENDFEYKKAEIDYSTFIESRSVNDKCFNFNLLHTNTISTSLAKIFDFLIVWQYLKDNGLVLEIEKEIRNKDISVFYYEEKKCSNLSEDLYIQPVAENTKGKDIVIDSIMDKICPSTTPPKRNAMDFVDVIIEFNEEIYKICEDKLSLKIIPTPELRCFTQRKFKTKEELFNRNSLLTAWIAIIITLVFSIINFVTDFISLNKNSDDITNYLHEIKILQQEVESLDKSINDLTELYKIINQVTTEVSELREDIDKYIDDFELKSKKAN